MKKNDSQKHPTSVAPKKSIINFFYNFSLIILAVVIIYMSYSLVNKLTSNNETIVDSENIEIPSAIVQVEVLNGCGDPGITEIFTDYLRSNKFDVVSSGNYISFDIDYSLVIDRTGNMANARKLAKALNINDKNVIQQLNNDYFLDVSLILGRDYKTLSPFK